MPTPEERIAAGQELRKRGKLSAQQDAALAELERRYGVSGKKTAMGKRGGMVTEGTISREEYMRQRGGQDVGTYPGGPLASRTDEGLLGMRQGVTKAEIKDTAKTLAALEQPMSGGVQQKMSQGQSVALGVTDLNPVRLATGDLGFEDAITQSLKDNPNSTRIGQAAAFTAGGAAQLGTRAIVNAPKLVAPAVAARFAGPGLASQAARYGGRGLVLAGEGTAGYYGYNALVEAPNQYREAGLPSPSVGERIDFANSQVFTPGGAIAAAAGPLVSGIYRTGRGIVAGSKNALASGGKTILPQGTTSATPIANLFTPSSVQRSVANSGITQATPSARGRTARDEAIDLLLAKGLNADQTEALVKRLSYDRYTTVDEMLFELANADIDQLAVAAARVGGDAKKTFREAFKARNAEMPERIRTQLRDAMALSGDELEDFATQMVARADEATADGYAAAYSQQVSDGTWASMWDRLSVSPDAADAIAAGARLARNSYRGNPAQLEVARQLEQLAGALGSPGTVPPKLSTHALDYLDRGFGSLIAGAKKSNPAFAASLIEIQKALRSAGLDADTGLSGPRGVYSQYKAAARAMDFGAKAFGKGTSLRDLKKQFAAELKDADEVFEDIVGEGRSVVDQALIMGWIRGAEDAIETATNPGGLIRQIYGSERQRAKLLEMMPKETDVMTSGVKSDQTKRIKALVGSTLGAEDYKFGFTLGSGARAEGRAAVPSLFERQRTMLENQGRVSGNSVTGDVTEAIANQGGLQRAANLIARTALNPQEVASNAVLWAVQKVTTPAIFKPEVNRELGRILTTRGRDELLAVIDEIRARQAATGRGPRPPSGGSPTPTTPIAAGGFAGFGRGYVDRLNATTTIAEAADVIARSRFKPAKRMERAATADDWTEATEEAADILRVEAQRQGGNDAAAQVVREFSPDSIADPKGKPRLVYEDLAAQILRSKGIDPEPIYGPMKADRLTNAERGVNAKLMKQAKGEAVVNDQMIDEFGPDIAAAERAKPPTLNGLGLRTDVSNALVGAGVGALGPAESNEERLRNMAIGAGVMGVGGRLSRTVGARNALAGETRTAGLSGGRRPPTQAPSLPTYKANPVKGQGFDEWLETLYSDAMRGPDNKTVLPNVFYRGMSDAEFEAAQKAGKFQSITNREGLYVEKDPTRYTGGGAYGAKRGGVIVQFDTTGLTPKTIRARTAGGFAEDGFDEIPNDKIARVWKWDPAKNDHVLVYEAGGERSLPPITPGGFAGGGSRGPKKPTGGKPKRDIGTKVADASAIAALSLAPPAQAQGEGTAELDAANERVRIANERVLQIEKTAIPQLEADLRLLEDPNADPRKIQTLLANRDFDLGPNGVDGRIGPDTRKAIGNNVREIKAEIAFQRQELEKARKEEADARKGVKDANMRAALREAEPNAAFDMATKAGQGAAFLGATYLAYRFRKGAVKAYEPVAKASARRANALVNTGPVKTGKTAPKTGENALNTRAANINEFWKQGGAGKRVPFQVDAQGVWSARPGAKEPSQLFRAPRYLPNDIKFMAGAAVEAGGTRYAADRFAAEADKAEADMEKALAAGDDVAFKAALDRKKSADGAEAFLRILERIGYGALAGRALGGLVRYPAVKANVNAADAERALLLQAMAKQKPATNQGQRQGNP